MTNISTSNVIVGNPPYQGLIKVPFHGANLYLVNNAGEPYTPMKPLVTGMKLTWHGQHAKLKVNRDRWGILDLRIPSEGGAQDMICMPLRKLPGWLMSIEPGKVKDPIVRARVIQYQNECDDALWKYWTEGVAVNERIAYSVGDHDTLTKAQQDVLRGLIETAAHRLPKERQAKAIIGAWSRLKSHFKVAYREIPQREFTEAVSIVQRATVEWELDDSSPFEGGNLGVAKYFKAAKDAFWEQVDASNINLSLDAGAEQKIVDGYVASMLSNNRWMMSFNYEGRLELHPISKDVSLFELKELPDRIREAGNMSISEVASIFAACAERMISNAQIARRHA